MGTINLINIFIMIIKKWNNNKNNNLPILVNFKPLKKSRHQNKTIIHTKTLVEGTILIIFVGPYISRKVIYIKQLNSGLLLCVCISKRTICRFPLKWCKSTSVIIKINLKTKNKLMSCDDNNFLFLRANKKKDNKLSNEFKSFGKKIVEEIENSISCKYIKNYLKSMFIYNKSIP